MSSLFGGAQAKPAGSSLFGGGAAQGTTSGGLFGASTQQNQQQQQGGGLFGQQNQQQQQQPQQQQSTAGSGLFGSATTQQNQPQQQSGGLFGASTQQNSQPQQQSGGLFGASQQPQQGGLLGAQPQQSTTTGGLFSGQASKPGVFGQQAQQPAQVSAVQVNYDTLRPRSRFDDLAKPAQDEIALIDKGITRVTKMKDEIGQFMPQHERDIEQLGRDVGFVESKFRTVQIALNRDIQTVKGLQDVTKKNITDAQLSFKATDNLKLPTHYHQTGLFATQSTSNASQSPAGGAANASTTHADAQDLITYFNRICDDVEKYKKRLDEYRDEIERDMPGVENGLYEQIRALRDRYQGAGNGNMDSMADQLGQVLLALREMGTAIVNQAGQIADTRERLSRLQIGIVDSGMYAAGAA